MDWADTKQVLHLWVQMRETMLNFCKQKERTNDEIVACAEKLVVIHEAPLGWIERLVITVTSLVHTHK